jgi:hypothetical protein
MSRFVSHIVLPVVMSVAFFTIAFTPIEVLGCRIRGLLALGVALLSGLAGVGTGVMGLKKRLRSEADSMWWMISTALLSIPVVGMIVLA